MATDQIIAITTTFSTSVAAEACGRRLVEQRLAACVQLEGPITSIFRWRGAVDVATEWRCTCKTTAQRQTECVAAIMAEHDYQTPQITIATVVGSPSYAAWIRESVIIG